MIVGSPNLDLVETKVTRPFRDSGMSLTSVGLNTYHGQKTRRRMLHSEVFICKWTPVDAADASSITLHKRQPVYKIGLRLKKYISQRQKKNGCAVIHYMSTRVGQKSRFPCSVQSENADCMTL